MVNCISQLIQYSIFNCDLRTITVNKQLTPTIKIRNFIGYITENYNIHYKVFYA